MAEEVQKFRQRMEELKSFHKECSDSIDWHSILNQPPPFEKSSCGPNEKAALKELDSYHPTIVEKLLLISDRRKEKLQEAVSSAKRDDVELIEKWEESIATAQSVVDGDIETYLRLVKEKKPLGGLAEYIQGIDYSILDPYTVEVVFNLRSKKVISNEELTLTKTGKVSRKKWTNSRFNELQQEYACSCTIRIARELFALLPVEMVYIHAHERILNTSTGHAEKCCLLTVKMDKPTLGSLNMKRIVCADAMKNFEHQMKFTKTKGFMPVRRLTPVGQFVLTT